MLKLSKTIEYALISINHINQCDEDIPISVKYFVEWLNAKMTKKEESTYFLSRFVIDFFNNLTTQSIASEV